MNNASPQFIRKYSALFLSCGVVSAWLLSSYWSSGKDLPSLKDLFGKSAEEHYETGLQDFQSGARQVAIDEFTKAIQLDPTFAAAYDARASVLFQMKDYAGASADCDKVMGIQHDDEHIYLIKGLCRYYLHDVKGARNILGTAIALNPDDPLARDVHGLALLELRDWDEAIVDFAKAIQVNPDDARAYFGRAVGELFLKEYEKSLSDDSDAIGLLDDTVTPGAYSLRAHIKSRLKDRAGALADANSGIELKKSDSSAYLTRATIELLWDDFSGASNDLRTAVSINPTNSEIYLYRGMIEQKLGKLDAALADYKQGLIFDTEAFHTADIEEAMGYAQAEMGRWQPALETFRKAMAFDSPPDDIRFDVFLIECRMGQTEQAKKELTAYIPSIPKAKAADWTTSVALFLAGTLDETNFLAQATTTAKRPTDVAGQIGDAYYFAGMEHLLAGDKDGASERFKKCLKVGDDNSYDYMMATSIMAESVTNQPLAKLRGETQK
ncbi:MAG TPA: tetratricopeptide repeat protein [Candidatus Sulfotelmatobacter sp.]|nr:tetratricopeptide repeat protein [Candidatus Sulfotelmatobacter sp.]